MKKYELKSDKSEIDSNIDKFIEEVDLENIISDESNKLPAINEEDVHLSDIEDEDGNVDPVLPHLARQDLVREADGRAPGAECLEPRRDGVLACHLAVKADVDVLPVVAGDQRHQAARDRMIAEVHGKIAHADLAMMRISRRRTECRVGRILQVRPYLGSFALQRWRIGKGKHGQRRGHASAAFYAVH